MKDHTITQLLRLFMDGKTSLEEEAELAEFFRNANAGDKPEGMDDVDWQTYREMFRQIDEGFEDVPVPAKHRKAHIVPLWKIASAAAISVMIAISATLLTHKEQNATAPHGHETMQLTAEVAKTDTVVADTVKTVNKENIHEKTERQIKTQRQRKLPYSMHIPKKLLAKAETGGMAFEDSIVVAIKEAEVVVEAMTIYQELKINEICNVEYEEY